MEKGNKIRDPDYGCENRCMTEYVDCIETEDGAQICKTRQQNCLGECRL